MKKSIHPDVFVNLGLVSHADIREAIKENVETGSSVAYLLFRDGKISEKVYYTVLKKACEITRVNLDEEQLSPAAVRELPVELAAEYKLAPFAIRQNTLCVAMADPLNRRTLAAVSKRTILSLRVFVAGQDEISEAIARSYYGDKKEETVEPGEEKSVSEELAMEKFDVLTKSKVDSLIYKHMTDDDESPAGRLLKMMFNKARDLRASDIHIDPTEDELRVRFRIDGDLHEMFTIDLEHQEELTNKIKIMSGMVIYEHRLPQDGKLFFTGDSGVMEVRTATYPVEVGEKIAMRVLRLDSVVLDLKSLGLEDDDHDRYSKLLQLKQGLILVVGPTGVGKSTTLYSSLKMINADENHIVTIENPIEFRVKNVVQSQIQPEIGYTFAAALKTILRLDPDVIMIGEIRDIETAEIAIRAALTGRLVFSTLHTGDSAGAYTRLLDMGIPPYLLTPTVAGILSQRLMRKLCPHCKQETTLPGAVLKKFDIDPDMQDVTFYKAVGCDKCNSIGYNGRLGVFEVLVPNVDVNKVLLTSRDTEEIRNMAMVHGLKTMKTNALSKAAQGQTSLEEVLRIIS